METASAANAAPDHPQPHILIIGAGVTGLVLAQALKKNSIRFTVFERDPNAFYRGRGWGLTIHWSLDAFISLLPQHLVDRLPEVYVDPAASKNGENGNFPFYDLKTGEARWKVPPAKRMRVSRERMRALLLEGLDVQWSKTLTFITTSPPHAYDSTTSTVIAHFADSTTATGNLLIGADGIRSLVRPALLTLSNAPPSVSDNTSLPARILGVSVIYPPSLALKLRALDLFFFQGGDPETDTFMYFSFLDTPSSYKLRESKDRDGYECQILISWPYRSGWRGEEQPLEIPEGNVKRLELMKDLTKGWAEPFRECLMSIPDEGTEVKALRLEDWVPRDGMWKNQGGRVTMAGDAAHAMTMFRGEGANHSIADVANLMQQLLPVFQNPQGPGSLQNAINEYEEEMIRRTAPAVLTSRRACLDAHDYKCINDQSPLISRRVMITQE